LFKIPPFLVSEDRSIDRLLPRTEHPFSHDPAGFGRGSVGTQSRHFTCSFRHPTKTFRVIYFESVGETTRVEPFLTALARSSPADTPPLGFTRRSSHRSTVSFLLAKAMSCLSSHIFAPGPTPPLWPPHLTPHVLPGTSVV